MLLLPVCLFPLLTFRPFSRPLLAAWAALFFSCELARVVDKLDDGQFRIVTRPSADANDARVSAVSVLITFPEFAEQALDGLHTGCTLDRVLCLALGTAEPALFALKGAVSGVEELSGLAAKMHFAGRSVIAVKVLRLSGQRDRLFDKRPKLFRLGNSGNDVLFLRIDQRRRHIAKHRHAMFRRPSQFPMCF